MLKLEKLLFDHYKVFKAITSYSVVDKEAVYERLGLYGVKRKDFKGNDIKGYLKNFKSMPKQLCSGAEFRNKIAGGGGQKSLIKKNMKPYGIPQGSPISDLIANIYLIDFEMAVKQLVDIFGGKYYRYSDDILIIVQSDIDALPLEESIRNAIIKYGNKLKIKEEKSSVFLFKSQGDAQSCELIKGEKGKNGIEYLGFRYDGKKIYIRDSTLANLRRKSVRAARCQAIKLVKRYPDKDYDSLLKLFNIDYFLQRFSKVENFDIIKEDYRNWTLWTYLTRSRKILGNLGSPIIRQVKNNRKIINRSVEEEISHAITARQRARSD